MARKQVLILRDDLHGYEERSGVGPNEVIILTNGSQQQGAYARFRQMQYEDAGKSVLITTHERFRSACNEASDRKQQGKAIFQTQAVL